MNTSWCNATPSKDAVVTTFHMILNVIVTAKSYAALSKTELAPPIAFENLAVLSASSQI